MAYKNLSTPTMVIISAAWLDKEHERPLIESLPQAGPLLISLDKAHKGLLHTQHTGESSGTALAAIQQKAAKIDVLHDRKARGLFGVLTAFADLADDPADAEAYLGLRDRLFPHGLKIIIWSYTDEAGDAKLVDKRLTPADKDLLKQLPAPKGTLADAHSARVKAGKELGELEKDRLSLRSQPEGTATTQSDVIRARNAWIRAVRAFVATLDLEESLKEADEEKILGPLREAERKADRREGSGAAAEPDAGQPAPTPEGADAGQPAAEKSSPKPG